MKQKLTWSTRKVPLKDLKLLTRNPRKASKKFQYLLKSSMEQFDLAEIPVVNTDMTVVAGNQRVRELRTRMNHKDIEIDVRYPSRKLTAGEVKAYAAKSNKISADWNLEMLKEDYSVEELVEHGFSSSEIEQTTKKEKELYKELDHTDPKIVEVLKHRNPFIVFQFTDPLALQSVKDKFLMDNRKCLKTSKLITCHVGDGDELAKLLSRN